MDNSEPKKLRWAEMVRDAIYRVTMWCFSAMVLMLFVSMLALLVPKARQMGELSFFGSIFLAAILLLLQLAQVPVRLLGMKRFSLRGLLLTILSAGTCVALMTAVGGRLRTLGVVGLFIVVGATYAYAHIEEDDVTP